MRTEEALKHIAEFKGNNLKGKLNDLKSEILGKTKKDIRQITDLYEAALEVKKISSQIDEIVHATGIIKCLPFILIEKEKIESLSLAAGAEGEGFDLVTNLRVAEFKFSRWQVKAANGMRKRQVFVDFVNLLLFETTKKKELYVFNAKKIIAFFQSKRATWKNVLSKSGGLDNKLEEFLKTNNIKGENLIDIYEVQSIKISDIDDLLN